MLFDQVLALVVRDGGAAVGVRDGGQHDVAEVGGGCGVDKSLALSDLGGEVGAERRGDREQRVGSGERGVEGGAIVEVGLAHLGAEVAQGFGGRRRGLAGECAYPVAGLQQGAGGGPALRAGGSGDGNGEHRLSRR